MRTVTNLFLLNMALSDTLSTVFAIPSVLAVEISPYYWPLGGFMCWGSRVISTVSVSVSIYTMVALALERYIQLNLCTSAFSPKKNRGERRMYTCCYNSAVEKDKTEKAYSRTSLYEQLYYTHIFLFRTWFARPKEAKIQIFVTSVIRAPPCLRTCTHELRSLGVCV